MGLCLPARTVINFLESKGFEFIRNKGSSHHIYSNGKITVPIPVHGNKDLGESFIQQILRETKMTKQDLLEYLGR